jgi:hypothetical protein
MPLKSAALPKWAPSPGPGESFGAVDWSTRPLVVPLTAERLAAIEQMVTEMLDRKFDALHARMQEIIGARVHTYEALRRGEIGRAKWDRFYVSAFDAALAILEYDLRGYDDFLKEVGQAVPLKKDFTQETFQALTKAAAFVVQQMDVEFGEAALWFWLEVFDKKHRPPDPGPAEIEESKFLRQSRENAFKRALEAVENPAAEGHGVSVPREQQRPKRPYRSQVGYTPPKRAKTVILKTSVKPALREEFHGVAETLGVTSEVLLEYLAQSAVTKASTDPAFMTALKNVVAEHVKQSEDARKRVLKKVSAAILKRTLG